MSTRRKRSSHKRTPQTVEEFIEVNKKACIASAKAIADDPNNAAQVEELLQANGFYRLLCGENAATNPRIRRAYNKYYAAFSGSKSKRPPLSGQHTAEELIALYEENKQSFRLTDEEYSEVLESASEAVAEYYSDINNFLSSELLYNLYNEPVTEQLISRFKSAAASLPGLGTDRLTHIIRRSRLYHRDLDISVMNGSWENLTSVLSLTAREKKFLRAHLANDPSSRPQTRKLYNDLIARYDADTVRKTVRESDSYKSALTHLENRLLLDERAAELILKEIPDSAADLYPGARRINRHFILHLGPTNSGKTYSALEACKSAGSGVYLGPLRLLAYEVCEKFNLDGIPCNMLTGEERITVDFAAHTSSTVEMFDPSAYYEVAVVDECQLIEDEERGGAWTSAILGLRADRIHLCAAPEAEDILISLIELCGDTYETVRHERFVPLKPDRRQFVFPDSVEPKDALIVFSKASVLACARELALFGIKASVIYGALPYDVRRSEVNRFIRGETDVVVATDAIGMGLNLPIQRIVFMETSKFDGHIHRFLEPSEAKQIAGRAGRRGIYDVGYYTAAEELSRIIKRVEGASRRVTTARLRFPETILTVDMPLSEIFIRWNSITNKEFFRKNIVLREIQLSRDLERYTDDKILIYRFVTIPFNEASDELYRFWSMLFESELHGRNDNAADFAMLIDSDSDDLDTLEISYRKCDILYAYFNKFNKTDELDEIMSLKRGISQNIIRILGEGHIADDIL